MSNSFPQSSPSIPVSALFVFYLALYVGEGGFIFLAERFELCREAGEHGFRQSAETLDQRGRPFELQQLYHAIVREVFYCLFREDVERSAFFLYLFFERFLFVYERVGLF